MLSPSVGIQGDRGYENTKTNLRDYPIHHGSRLRQDDRGTEEATPDTDQAEWLMLNTSQTDHNMTGVEMSQDRRVAAVVNSPAQVLFASLIGTTIEFFDFYIYATAAVLVFPKMFFPASDPTTATLASLATFGIAFLARPIGSALFGHFGDRVGRKTTLVAALLTMGLSTVAIGTLPGYNRIGVAAPLLLARSWLRRNDASMATLTSPKVRDALAPKAVIFSGYTSLYPMGPGMNPPPAAGARPMDMICWCVFSWKRIRYTP